MRGDLHAYTEDQLVELVNKAELLDKIETIITAVVTVSCGGFEAGNIRSAQGDRKSGLNTFTIYAMFT